jgi:citrate lyase subunit gamma (acyl carrier protein)
MEIKKTAIAGTLESSDIQLTISKSANGNQIELQSDVQKVFGKQIKAVIMDMLAAMHIENAKVKAIDKGALDCVIKARTIAVIQRATETVNQPAWEVL